MTQKNVLKFSLGGISWLELIGAHHLPFLARRPPKILWFTIIITSSMFCVCCCLVYFFAQYAANAGIATTAHRLQSKHICKVQTVHVCVHWSNLRIAAKWMMIKDNTQNWQQISFPEYYKNLHLIHYSIENSRSTSHHVRADDKVVSKQVFR